MRGRARASRLRRYAGALKRRLRRAVGSSARADDTDDGVRCPICGSPASDYAPVSYLPDPTLQRVRRTSTCTGCGFVAVEELSADHYRAKKDLSDLPVAERIGTDEKPGREYRMARMAIDILGRRDLEVMVYGIGRSMDNHHIQKMHRVRNVAIGDIMKLRDDAEFHDVNEPARKQFAVVVASEVVEHFRDPTEDFRRLFGFVEEDGLLVCSTNIYAGGDLAKERYIFYPDHTAYYTPEALLTIARAHGFLLDFRAPKMGGSPGGKRYVLFTRSPDVLQNAALYFGRRVFAPSE